MNFRIPFTQWYLLFSFHPRWKDKDGHYGHMQVWHSDRQGFIVNLNPGETGWFVR